MTVYEVETWRDSQLVETRTTTRDGGNVVTTTTFPDATSYTRPATDAEIAALEGVEALHAIPSDPLHQLAQAIVAGGAIDGDLPDRFAKRVVADQCEVRIEIRDETVDDELARRGG